MFGDSRLADRFRRSSAFTAGIDLARQVLPKPILGSLRSQMVRGLKGGPREVFTEIYRRNIWGYQETVSGSGSTLHYTRTLRSDLPLLVADLKVDSLLDVPCGDFNWMAQVQLPAHRYLGGDIVAPLIDDLNAKYGRFDREFRVIDLSTETLPQADLLLCRDCFMHFSEQMNFQALANILRSDVKFLLISNYPEGVNRSIRVGDWFAINLRAAPYNLPPPARTINDWMPPFERRELALWDIAGLRTWVKTGGNARLAAILEN